MDVNAYLQLRHTRSLDCTVNSFEKLSSVDNKKGESLLHHLPLGLIVELLGATQLLFLFSDGSFQ